MTAQTHISQAITQLIAQNIPLDQITAALHKLAIDVEDMHRDKLQKLAS